MQEKKNAPLRGQTNLSKDKDLVCKSIVDRVEAGTKLKLDEIKAKYGDGVLLFTALQLYPTTLKAVRKALGITENTAWGIKKQLAKKKLIDISDNKVRCPYSGRLAHQLIGRPCFFNTEGRVL